MSSDPQEVPGQEVCVSLRVLANTAHQALQAGQPLPEAVASLGGIGQVEGYVVDSARRDVVLVGRQAAPGRSLTLEDLRVNFSNIWRRRVAPYCSLDPRPEDVRAANELVGQISRPGGLDDLDGFYLRLKRLWGPQQVVVGGVPDWSRHARVMIEADYHMKQLAQGHVAVEGLTSYLDRALQAQKDQLRSGRMGRAPQAALARFWFHVAEGDPAFWLGRQSVWIRRCTVVLLTEKQQATADGRLRDCGEDDPLGQAFAAEVSRQMGKLGQRVPVYQDLQNLFSLSALLRALFFRNDAQTAGLDVDWFVADWAPDTAKPLPKSLPGLVNRRTATVRVGNALYMLQPMVCGGVDMALQIRSASFLSDASGRGQQRERAVLAKRPGPETLAWRLQ